jgi:hypothetical protein
MQDLANADVDLGDASLDPAYADVDLGDPSMDMFTELR